MYYPKDKLKIPPHEIEQAEALTLVNLARMGTDKKYMLSFSGGKDSIVLLEMALKAGITPEIYHQYIIPGLSFNEEIFAYYEGRGVKINQIEGGIPHKMKSADLLCINKVWNMETNNVNPMHKTEEFLNKMLDYDFNLIGIKQNDSPGRRLNIDKLGWMQPNAKKAYPIYQWSDKQVFAYLYKNELPVNKTYEMFGRSMDVINWESIDKVRANFPEDYKKIVHLFPLTECLAWAKDGFAGEFCFSPEAKAGNLYNYGQDLDKYFILAFDDAQKKKAFAKIIFDKPGKNDAEIVYLQGRPYNLASAEYDYTPPEDKVIDQSNLHGKKQKYMQDISKQNSLDYFVILCFKTVGEKRLWAAENGLNPDVNAVPGLDYEIIDAEPVS